MENIKTDKQLVAALNAIPGVKAQYKMSEIWVRLANCPAPSPSAPCGCFYGIDNCHRHGLDPAAEAGAVYAAVNGMAATGCDCKKVRGKK